MDQGTNKAAKTFAFILMSALLAIAVAVVIKAFRWALG
jgi:hypothetical protein